MPVYNDETYIQASIESVIAQTYTNFELLIIDDGCNDRTPEIILSNTDGRIRYVRNEQNLGLTKSLNKGLSLANGEYIARQDSDDLMAPTRLEKQLDFLRNNRDISMVGSFWQTIDSQNNPVEIIRWPVGYHNSLYNVLIGDNPVSTILVRTDHIKKIQFDERFVQTQDWDFYLRSYAAGFRTDNIPQVLNKIRVHEKQISSNFSGNQYQNHCIAFQNFFFQVVGFEISIKSIETYVNTLTYRTQKIYTADVETLFHIFFSLYNGLKSIHICEESHKKQFIRQVVYSLNSYSFVKFIKTSLGLKRKYDISLKRLFYFYSKIFIKRIIYR